MRELKFRVWDNWSNAFMVQEYRKFWQSKGYGETDMGDIFTFPQSYGNRWVIQQFTGLKDKNGKEIYEGDILKIRIEKDWQISLYTVKDMQEFYLECNQNDSYYRINETEIIGNIFENPELLK